MVRFIELATRTLWGMAAFGAFLLAVWEVTMWANKPAPSAPAVVVVVKAVAPAPSGFFPPAETLEDWKRRIKFSTILVEEAESRGARPPSMELADRLAEIVFARPGEPPTSEEVRKSMGVAMDATLARQRAVDAPFKKYGAR